MKIIKPLIALVVVAIVAFFAWNYFAGPLKMRRDMHAFADSVARCEPFSQAIESPVDGGGRLHRSVEGLRDGRCHVRMETLGPHVLRCAFAPEDLPAIGQGFAELARQVGVFGGMRFQYSSSDPDPLARALNSDACETVIE